jgi:Na+-translocating ferredoxin:NAD+ oxidoreductase RnfD subunit
LEGLILGIAAALAFGKHAFGGTGRNFLNPAILGYLIIAVVFETDFRCFNPHGCFFPAFC